MTAGVCRKGQLGTLKGDLRSIVEAVFAASNRAAELTFLVARGLSLRRVGDTAYFGAMMQDTGIIAMTTEAPQDVSFRRMSALQREVAEIVARDPEVAAVTSVVGAGTINAAQNTGRLTVVLRPRAERRENEPGGNGQSSRREPVDPGLPQHSTQKSGDGNQGEGAEPRHRFARAFPLETHQQADADRDHKAL